MVYTFRCVKEVRHLVFRSELDACGWLVHKWHSFYWCVCILRVLPCEKNPMALCHQRGRIPLGGPHSLKRTHSYKNLHYNITNHHGKQFAWEDNWKNEWRGVFLFTHHPPCIMNWWELAGYLLTGWTFLALCLANVQLKGHSEPAPTSAPRRMNDKWSGNNFRLGSSSLTNHGG